jgi:hypothetical protein
MHDHLNRKLGGQNWLGYEISSSAQNRPGHRLKIRMERDKNDRGRLVMRNGAQLFAQLDAIHARHVDVQQNQVWLQFFRFLNGF